MGDLPRVDYDLNSVLVAWFVAAHGSFEATADGGLVPYGSRSALSQRVRKLEADLGFPLFRKGSSVRVTDEGARVIAAAKAALLDLHEAVERERDRSTPKISIGGAAAFAREWPWMLQRLCAKHPRVSPDLVCDAEDNLVARLRAGTLDLAVLPLAHRFGRGFTARRLVSLPIVLLVPKDHPFRRPEDLAAEKQLRDRVALPGASPTVIARLKKNLRRLGIRLGPTLRCELDHVQWHVGEGDHIGLSLQDPSRITHPNVRAIPLESFGRVEIGVVARAPWTSLHHDIFDLLRERVRFERRTED